MYDANEQNIEQLQSLIAKIRQKREELDQKKKDLELTSLDLRDAEERALDALSKMNSNTVTLNA
jgi:vacuolar-type H+-ATPase subunit I/STV1